MKPGSILDGKYELRRRIGTGAMGVVWEGFNTRTEREVAVKLLAARGREEDRQRLLREARAGGRIRHPNVLDVYDVAETESGSPFIVMELLRGETLAHRLERAPLPLGEALHILRDVARGLGAAHKVGVVHRNLKPHNVYLHAASDDDEPTVKLFEFGISRIDAEETLTLKGITLGSPGYVAPEQIDGRDVDARADIWAFGALAYELIAGEPLFDGTTPAEILQQVTSAPFPELDSIDSEIDTELDALVGGCLVRNLDQRFQSIAQATDLLEQVLAVVVRNPGLADHLPGTDEDEPTAVTRAAGARISSARATFPSDAEDPIPTLHFKRSHPSMDDTPTGVSVIEGTPIETRIEVPKLPRVAWSPSDDDTEPEAPPSDDPPARAAASRSAASPVPSAASPAPSAASPSAGSSAPSPPSSVPPPSSQSSSPAPSSVPPTATAPSSPPPRSSPPPERASVLQSRRAVEMFQDALSPEAEPAPPAKSRVSQILFGIGLLAAAGIGVSLAARSNTPPPSAPVATSVAKTAVTGEPTATGEPAPTATQSSPTGSAAPSEPSPSASASTSSSASAAASPSASAATKAPRPHVVRARPPSTPSPGAPYNPSSL